VRVERDSRRNVGKIRKISASSSFRSAVVEKTAPAFSIAPLSCPERSESAPKASPPLRTKSARATSWLSSSRSRRSASSANDGRLAIAIEKSSPRPRSEAACPCIHAWKAARVRGSKARKISSS
jgi:hypothetical protein